MARPHSLVSLYTGSGGLDLGLEAANFETRVAVEMDSDSARTLRANREWPVIEEDIHRVSSERILRTAGLRVGDTDLLAGGPPCQPFSKSGYWARGDVGRLEDPRATTLEAYLRVLRDIQPKVFLLENVPGLAYREKSEGRDLLQRTVEAINAEVGTHYSFEPMLLNAAEFGVPQVRERVFIIGHRDGRKFKFPNATHSFPSAERQRDWLSDLTEPIFTAWDAIGDLEDDDDPGLALTGRWARLLPSIPEGRNYLHHTDRGEGVPIFGWRRRYWSFLLKLAKDLPSWTLTAQPGPAIGPFHWKNRRLSVDELLRLQTYPENYYPIGTRGSIQRQIGNAVPAALAEYLGLHIRDQLFDDQAAIRQPRKLLPRRRSPIPSEDPVARVPRQYMRLKGDHSPHPGTRKGFGAVARLAEFS
jgi:DNA (cytosine-5)-methyltransferase 1